MRMGMGGSLAQKIPSAIIAEKNPRGAQDSSLCLLNESDHLLLVSGDLGLLENQDDYAYFHIAFNIGNTPDFGDLLSGENYKEISLFNYGMAGAGGGMFIDVGLYTSGLPGTETQVGRYYVRTSYASEGGGDFRFSSMQTPFQASPVWPPEYWNQLLVKFKRESSTTLKVTIWDRHISQGDNTATISKAFDDISLDLFPDAFESGKRGFRVGKNLEPDAGQSTHTDRFFSFNGIIDELSIFDLTSHGDIVGTSPTEVVNLMEDGTDTTFDANMIGKWNFNGSVATSFGPFALSPQPFPGHFISYDTTDLREWTGQL